MKKSQIAAALALTYVAGTAMPLVMPVSAAGVVCDPSVVAETYTFQATEVRDLVAKIKSQDIYQKYVALNTLKAKYLTPKTTGGTDTLAKQYDDAKATTISTLNATYTKEYTYNAMVEIVKNTADIISTKDSEVADSVKEATEKAPYYTVYKNLYTAAKATKKDRDALVEAVKAVNAAYVGKGRTAPYADTVIAASQDAAAIAAEVIKSNYVDYTNYAKVLDVQAELTKIAEETQTQAQGAKDVAAAVAEIKAAIKAVNAVTDTDYAADKKVADVAAYIDKTSDSGKVTNFKKWNALIDLVEATHGNYDDATKNAGLITALKDELDKVKDSDGKVGTITVADLVEQSGARTICGTNTNVMVAGKFPVSNAAVSVEEYTGAVNIADLPATFSKKVAYDIKLNYKGSDYANKGGVYTVTVKAAGLDVKNAVVRHLVGDKWEVVAVKGYNEADSTVTFETSSFSVYAVVAPEAPKNTDNTGNGNVDNDDQNQGNVSGGNSSVDGDKGQSSQDTTKKPSATVKNPNTGIAPKAEKANVAEGVFAASARANANASATIAVIAGVASVLAAAIAVIRRFAKRA